MSSIVQKYWFFINFLLKTKIRKQRRAVIKSADKDQIKVLAEIFANTLGGSIPVSPTGRKQLRPFKNILGKISHKTTPGKDRKCLIHVFHISSIIFKHIVLIIKLLNFVRPTLELLKQ